ncbi:MAG: hypothetical protein CM15mP18_4720 [Methanobacteriota archaeon]|nr:MAG: hypothetical protein CM15mP18_4720 [Euryarchaeota archaeon]
MGVHHPVFSSSPALTRATSGPWCAKSSTWGRQDARPVQRKAESPARRPFSASRKVPKGPKGKQTKHDGSKQEWVLSAPPQPTADEVGRVEDGDHPVDSNPPNPDGPKGFTPRQQNEQHARKEGAPTERREKTGPQTRGGFALRRVDEALKREHQQTVNHHDQMVAERGRLPPDRASSMVEWISRGSHPSITARF